MTRPRILQIIVALPLTVFSLTLTPVIASCGNLPTREPAAVAPSLDLIPQPQKVKLSPTIPLFVSALAPHYQGSCLPEVKNAVDGFTNHFRATPEVDSHFLKINCQSPGELKNGVDESYRLSITRKEISIDASTSIGALRGLSSLIQLAHFQHAASQKGAHDTTPLDRGPASFPIVEIMDSPRYAWRGLMLDSARHFLPVPLIKRNLDAMFLVKLNVLHWHLTDDQAFRVESRKFPLLHARGSNGKYYTQDEIREIVTYAGERGIRVVPEFDMPGHMMSWFVGYPQYASSKGPHQTADGFGIFDEAINPALEETYTFLDSFFAEMAELFPDQYVHIGGDEVLGKVWSQNPAIEVFRKQQGLADRAALQSYFTGRIKQIVARNGKRVLGWEEIRSSDLNQQAAHDVLLESWNGQEDLAKDLQAGYTTLVAGGYYLDSMVSAQEYLLTEPTPENLPVTTQQAQRVIGGEACMWSEFVDEHNIESRIWPRAAAIAEVFWSERRPPTISPERLYLRLQALSQRLSELGLQHEKSQTNLVQELAKRLEMPVPALQELTGLIQPITNRYAKFKKWRTTTPLNLIADVATPDPSLFRNFDLALRAMLSSAAVSSPVSSSASSTANAAASSLQWDGQLDSLTAQLKKWRSLGEQISANKSSSSEATELREIALLVSRVSQVGLEAIEFRRRHKSPNAAWHTKARDTLKQKAPVTAQVEILLNYSVLLLVESLNG